MFVGTENQVLVFSVTDLQNPVFKEEKNFKTLETVTGVSQRGTDLFFTRVSGSICKLSYITSFISMPVYFNEHEQDLAFTSIIALRKAIYAGRSDGKLEVVSPTTEKNLRVVFLNLDTDVFVAGIEPTPTEEHIVLALSNGSLIVHSTLTDEVLITIGLHSKEITAINILGNLDELLIATGSDDGVVSLVKYDISKNFFVPIVS